MLGRFFPLSADDRKKNTCNQKMDFDIKTFFQSPPRIKDEVRIHIQTIATKFVFRFIAFVKMLGLERVLPRHVRVIVFQMCSDPYTIVTRQGLAYQQSRVKNMLRLLQRALDNAEGKLKEDAKYGGIDKRVVKGTSHIFEQESVRASTGGIVCVAACAAEICGLILNATHQKMTDQKTMTLKMIEEYGTMISLSDGQTCAHTSMIRLLHSLNSTIAASYMTMENTPTSDKRNDHENEAKVKSSREARISAERTSKSFRQVEEKNVHFEDNVQRRVSVESRRPSTPDNCFWED